MTPSQFIHTAPRESDRVLHPEQDLQPSRPVLRCPATGGDNLWILLFVELGKQIERDGDICFPNFKFNVPGCSPPLCRTVTPPAYPESGLPDAESQDHIPGELSEIHFLAHHPSPADHRNLGRPRISFHLELHQ